MNSPSAHCRRALHRHITLPKDSIWITDGLLAHAFDRFCRVSTTFTRKASKVPGPLEAQRRLGRRRMAVANDWHGPPTPPPWAFLMPLNLTRWTWKPPTPTEARRSNPSRLADSTAALAALLPQWLRESSQELDGLSMVAMANAAGSDQAASDPAPLVAPTDPQAAFMDGFRRAADGVHNRRFLFEVNKICGQMRQRIILGDISPGEVLALSNEIWRTLESRLPGSPRGRRWSLSFCRAIISGLSASKVFPASSLDTRFWNAFFSQVSKLPVNDTVCNLFAKALATMPIAYRSHVSGRLLSVLASFFSAWNHSTSPLEGSEIGRLTDMAILGGMYAKQQEVRALPASLRQALTISDVLQDASQEATKEFCSMAYTEVLKEILNGVTDGRMLRYGWLYILARNPDVNQDFFFDFAASLSEGSLHLPPLSVVEVSSLLLTQWGSRGYLRAPKEVYKSYRRHCGTRDEAALASLFLAVFARGEEETKTGLYYSAWKFLTRIRRKDYVLRSLQFDTSTGMLPVRMLEDLAFTADDHNIAVQLHDLWSEDLKSDPGHRRTQPQWFPGVFDKYAETMIHDAKLSPKEIWRVLDIGKLERPPLHAQLRHHRGTFGQRRAAVVEKMAHAFTEAPHLTNRAAFRHVSRSLAFLREIRGPGGVPEAVIQDLYQIITQDLWEERPGRTMRLLWFLRIIEQRHGLEMAWHCRVALRRWRARLKQIVMRKYGIKNIESRSTSGW
ncbi:uncharacterized protein C8A04DRAFT_8808 [Dichotomopilus funicola]|uniref:Uncharacterized protein n=1 Tax=Dichotomopilus funicola TaxID=1934379 RepID=A0AAN6ZRQ4_9PEZI|nr:hypothetical protein C8A04DRAFT_8808 [Dichotomopilus funicola]